MNLRLQISTTFFLTFSKEPNIKKDKRWRKNNIKTTENLICNSQNLLLYVRATIKLHISAQKFHHSLSKIAHLSLMTVFFFYCSVCNSPFSLFNFIQEERERVREMWNWIIEIEKWANEIVYGCIFLSISSLIFKSNDKKRCIKMGSIIMWHV